MKALIKYLYRYVMQWRVLTKVSHNDVMGTLYNICVTIKKTTNSCPPHSLALLHLGRAVSELKRSVSAVKVAGSIGIHIS